MNIMVPRGLRGLLEMQGRLIRLGGIEEELPVRRPFQDRV